MKRPDYSQDRFRRLVVPSLDGEGEARVTWVTPGDRMAPWRPGGYAESLWVNGSFPEAKDLGPIAKYASEESMDEELSGMGLRYSKEWFGATNDGDRFRSWKDVLKLFSEGWNDGRKMLEENREAILRAFPEAFGLAKGRRRVRRYGAVGDAFNPDNRGDMDRAWISRRRISRGHGPIVSLAFKSGFNSNQDAKSASWVPVAPLVLAQALEESGYSVELVGLNVVKHGPGRNYRSIEVIPLRIKASDEPFRMTAVTAMMHPVAHRTVGFQELCLSDTSETVDYCLGQAWNRRDGKLSDRYDLSKFGFEGTPVYIQQAFSLEAAKAAITEGMEALA